MHKILTSKLRDYSVANVIFSFSDRLLTVPNAAVNCILLGHARLSHVENDQWAYISQQLNMDVLGQRHDRYELETIHTLLVLSEAAGDQFCAKQFRFNSSAYS